MGCVALVEEGPHQTFFLSWYETLVEVSHFDLLPYESYSTHYGLKSSIHGIMTFHKCYGWGQCKAGAECDGPEIIFRTARFEVLIQHKDLVEFQWL